MSAVPYWTALGDTSLIAEHAPIATFNAESTNNYDEWLRIESPEPVSIGDGDYGGILVTVEVSGMGVYQIGVDGLSVTRTVSGSN